MLLPTTWEDLFTSGDTKSNFEGKRSGAAKTDLLISSIKYFPPDKPLLMIKESSAESGALIHPMFFMKDFSKQMLISEPAAQALPLVSSQYPEIKIVLVSLIEHESVAPLPQSPALHVIPPSVLLILAWLFEGTEIEKTPSEGT